MTGGSHAVIQTGVAEVVPEPVRERLDAALRLTGDGPVDRRLRDSDTPGPDPARPQQDPPTLAPQTLTVVANPSVLEAALASGSRLPLA
jgi:hypothetical protein